MGKTERHCEEGVKWAERSLSHSRPTPCEGNGDGRQRRQPHVLSSQALLVARVSHWHIYLSKRISFLSDLVD